MYCPRCKVQVGNEKFCEGCGGSTVESIDNVNKLDGGTNDIQEEKLNFKIPKLSLKKVLSIIVILVLGTGFLLGYKNLKERSTPKYAVEKFYTYISHNDYEKAYKMLSGTDDTFLSKEIFKQYVQQLNIKSFTIENFVIGDYPPDISSEVRTNMNVSVLGNSMFTVKSNGKVYPIGAVENGKNFIIFDDYKIRALDLTTKWNITAPKGSKVLVNGKEPEIVNDSTENTQLQFPSDTYNPEVTSYSIKAIYPGEYEVSATMEGVKDIKIKSLAGMKLKIDFVTNEDATTVMQEQSKKFLELYCSNATKEQYKDVFTNDYAAFKKADPTWRASPTIITKLKDFKITKTTVDDVDHVQIIINGTISYEDSSMAIYGVAVKTGVYEINTQLYMVRQNGKWLISDIGYIN